MRGKTTLALMIVTCFATTSARAQEATPETSSQEVTTAESTSESESESDADGGRFRFGINAALGFEDVGADNSSASGLMYGFDLRLGWQFSDLLAIYVQPHLSFGSLEATTVSSAGAASVSGFTGTFIVTAMGEATFDSFFVGGGLGYGVLNNPSGVTIDLKAGYYPFWVAGESGGRRKGFMIALDYRHVFLEGASGDLIMGCVGYESF